MSDKNISVTNFKKIYKFMNLHKHSDLNNEIYVHDCGIIWRVYAVFLLVGEMFSMQNRRWGLQ